MKTIKSLGTLFVTFAIVVVLPGCAGMLSFLTGAKEQADKEGAIPSPMSAIRILLNGLMQLASDNSSTLLLTGGTAAALQHAHSGLPFTERRARIKKENDEWEAETPSSSVLTEESK